jgi:hypothetical protein
MLGASKHGWSWLAIIFASFSLFGPSNLRSHFFRGLGSGRNLPDLPAQNPFTGLLQISKGNLLNALPVLPP